jgi:hypothetical protein
LHTKCGKESEKYAANEALDRLLWRENLAERSLAEELAAEEAANIRDLRNVHHGGEHTWLQ